MIELPWWETVWLAGVLVMFGFSWGIGDKDLNGRRVAWPLRVLIDLTVSSIWFLWLPVCWAAGAVYWVRGHRWVRR